MFIPCTYNVAPGHPEEQYADVNLYALISWKFTFIILSFQIGTNIPYYLQQIKAGVKQPHVLALGERENPLQAFLIIERNAVEQQSLLGAVDSCFKAFYILDSQYPVNSHSVWEFIQDIIFDMPKPRGEKDISKNVISLRQFFAP